MVLVDSRGISRVPRYSGTCPASQIAVVYRAVTVYGRSFQIVRLANWFVTCRPFGPTGPTTPPCKHDGLGCSAFARRYWRNHCCFLFLWVLRWFTSPRCLHTAYGFSGGSFGINQRGFPHSDIPGSKLVCSSPGLIAAYRVLHRLLAPRHSPYALSSLTTSMSNPISNEVALVNDCIRSLLRIHCVCYQGTLLKRSGRHCGSEKNYRLQDIQL